jgi:hypothetical protein
MKHIRGIASLLAMLLTTSCGGGGDDDGTDASTAQRLAELQAQRSNWEAHAAARYVYTLSWFCFCLDRGPYTVTVQSGKVAGAVYLGDGRITASSLVPPKETLTSLFDIAANAISRHAATVNYTLDPRDGYITSLYIDHIKEATDDEITYGASGYTPY